jgi:hypothetical protein
MAPHGVQLPQKPVLSPGGLVLPEQPIDQAGNEVRAQRQASREVTLALMLRPRPLQKRGVRQDIRRRPDLTEELLRREQSKSFGWLGTR